MNLTKEQQQFFAKRFSEECDKITMSWSNDLREWYEFAQRALDHSNIAQMQIPATKYSELFDYNNYGLNMNVVAVLANNLELRKPAEMGVTPKVFSDILELNTKIGKYWEALAEPVRKQIFKEIEIMGNKPKLVTVGQA